MTTRPVTNFAFSLTLDKTHDKQTKFLLHFLNPRGPKRAEKNFQLNRKKKNFQDCSNICPSGFQEYKNLSEQVLSSNSSKYYAAWLKFCGKYLVQLFTVNRALCNIDHIVRKKKGRDKDKVMWHKNLTETMYEICELNFLDVNSGYQEIESTFPTSYSF